MNPGKSLYSTMLFRFAILSVFVVFGAVYSPAYANPPLDMEGIDSYEELETWAAVGNVDARLKLAAKYIDRGMPLDLDSAARHLRAILWTTKDGEGVLEAGLLLGEILKIVRHEFPEITDEEYDKAFNSVGVALFMREDKRCVDVLIREAWLLRGSAQMMLAYMYEFKIANYAQHSPRILSFYKQAAAEGVPRARLNLGKAYFYGWGVKKDTSKALELLEQSKLGEGYMIVGGHYFKDDNYRRAEKYLLLAAAHEIPRAFYNLGVIAEVQKKYETATINYRRAMELDPGYNHARVELGRMYLWAGEGEADEIRGFDLVKQVADTEDVYTELKARAQSIVGILYRMGIGVKQSDHNARDYMGQAAAAGDEGAQRALADWQ